MRVRIDLDDDLRSSVKEYADANGLKMSRAYRELIIRGLPEDTDESERSEGR